MDTTVFFDIAADDHSDDEVTVAFVPSPKRAVQTVVAPLDSDSDSDFIEGYGSETDSNPDNDDC